MFQEKVSVRSVRLAIGLLAGLAAGQSIAQEAIQKVEITGSSIRRIVKEGALPVQVISKETIAKTGATTVADVVQKLPAMQGFTIEAIAAGSNSGGRTTASIHDLGSAYTLVLLNGRRIAPLQDSGSSVNLNAIPMSAVERIEILTDGASALYGADAIAGVINFVLKKNYQGLTVEGTFVKPQHQNGENSNFSITGGYGDLQADRFNVMATYRHDDQKQLKATDREFARTSYIPFTYDGRSYIYDRTSTSLTPANVDIQFNTAANMTGIGFNPYQKKNNNCGDMNVVSLFNDAFNTKCAFDFVQTVEIVPESKRDSFFATGRYKINDSLTAYADASIARFDLTARIAPNPVSVPIPIGSALYNQYVLPYLTAAQAAQVRTATAAFRANDWGTRDSQTITNVNHYVAGLEGEAFGWDFNTGATFSKYKIDERYVGGYMLNTEFRAMINNGLFDPFAPAGGQSAATQTLIQNSLFKGSIREAYSEMKGIDIRGSRELFTLPGGTANIGVGADYRELNQVQTATTAAKNGTIYAFSAPAEFDYTRSSSGLFAELAMPVIKDLEVTAALRYDSYSAVEDAIKNVEVGKKQSSDTYKVAFRYQPTKTLLLRGSYGTGFRVPNMDNIASPVVSAGVTAAARACPAALVAENKELCKSGVAQYPVQRGGNKDLSPEESKQYAVGFRIEPSANFSFGMDLWDVNVKNQVSSVTEALAFSDATLYRQLFTTFKDPASGIVNWSFLIAPLNIGRTHNRGIDWDVTVSDRYDFGKLTLNANGTYMLKSAFTVPGTQDQWTDAMNKFGILDNVTFRNIMRFSATLDSGKLSNVLTLNWRNGYSDAPTTVYSVADKKNTTTPIRLDVPSYTQIDYQGRYVFNSKWDVRFGVKNLLDKEPPLSLRASSGHQVGYDPRYADTMGRSYYLSSTYKFF